MQKRKYICRDCGEEFTHSVLRNLAAYVVQGPVCVDPAPTPASLFAKPRCPNCHSRNLKKI